MLRMTGKTHHAVHQAMLSGLLGFGLAALVFSAHAERFKKDLSVSIADVPVEYSSGSSQIERNDRGGRLVTSLSTKEARAALTEALSRLQLVAKPREPADARLLSDWVL